MRNTIIRQPDAPRLARRHPRRGSAPVEFVMALPVLLLMFVLILSVGLFFLSQVKATVTARSDTFQQRSSARSSRPLAYSSQTSTGDIYSRTATDTPDYPSPAVNFGSVSVEQSVLGGSWDHRELLQGNGPHWKDMAKASVFGSTNKIGSLLDQLTSGFNLGDIPELGDIPGIGPLLDQLGSVTDQFNNEQNNQQAQNQKNIEKLQKRIDELKAERANLQGELDNTLYPKRKQLSDQIEKRQELIDKEKDADKKKELQKQQDADKDELKQTNQQIKEKEDRIQAIDKEIDATQGIIDRLKQL